MAPLAPGGKTKVSALDRNDCTYKCPLASKVTPHGSHTVPGVLGLLTVRTGVTLPLLLAA